MPRLDDLAPAGWARLEAAVFGLPRGREGILRPRPATCPIPAGGCHGCAGWCGAQQAPVHAAAFISQGLLSTWRLIKRDTFQVLSPTAMANTSQGSSSPIGWAIRAAAAS